LVRDADMEGNLELSSASLAELCNVLGISTADLAATESPAAFVHSFEVSAADAAHLNPGIVRTFTDQFGSAARIELRTGDLTELVIETGVADDAITAFARSALSGGPYQAIVNVDKGQLIREFLGTPTARPLRVFLFADALSRILVRGIASFESEVWGNSQAPLVILVLDTEVELRGELLTVLGGSAIHEVAKAATLPASVYTFDAVIASRDELIGWDNLWTKALTPWHFDLSGACEDERLLGLLRAQLVKLAVLFTCDRARVRPGPNSPLEILGEYRGRDHVAIVAIDERAPLECTEAEAGAVLKAVEWCYHRQNDSGRPEWASDRLPFMQTRVAQSLEPRPIEERLAAFVRSMPYLLEGIEWHWKAFIEGKVREYLDQVEQVEGIINETVKRFGDAAAELTKGLSDTILAAVAVLIGSFIAAAFNSPFNATLFQIGVLTYAGYVLLFPGAVGLTASSTRLKRQRSEFDSQIKRFNETLYPDKVKEIVGARVSGAQRSYHKWLTFVAFVYVIVVVLAVVAALTVPGVVGQKGRPAKTTVTTAASAVSPQLHAPWTERLPRNGKRQPR
jgi:hypothetical protein